MKSKIKILNKTIGNGYPCFVIAEAGSNHNRKLSQAKKLIDVAKEAGADAVKFQHYKAERMYPNKNKSVEYLKKLGISKPIYELIKEIEIPAEWTEELSRYCQKKNIIFLSTPFSEEDVDIIDPYVPAFKIASYELTHLPLIRYIAQKGKPLIISTGASKGIEEIRQAVKTALSVSNDKICLMQCTAKYPAPLETINAKVIQTLKKEFGLPVGLSDHSQHALYGAAAALAVGADLYEKHFTISRKMKGPDHLFSLEPGELKDCISLIRNIEIALGKEKKELQEVEKELVNYRRSIYTIKLIKKGDKLTQDNIKILRRPGDQEIGIEPADYGKILDQKAKKNLAAFKLLQKEDF